MFSSVVPPAAGHERRGPIPPPPGAWRRPLSGLRHKLKLHPAGSGDLGNRAEPRISASRQAAREAHTVDGGSPCDFRYAALCRHHVTKSFHQQSRVAVELLCCV